MVYIDELTEDINSEIFNIFYSFNFVPLINVPTRVTDISVPCIDHFWYNEQNFYISSALPSDVTNHYPIFVSIDIVNNNTTITKTFRNHFRPNLSLLSSDVSVLCDNYCRETEDMEVYLKCEWFINNLWNVYRRCCPKKTKILSLKKLLKPWITDNIRRMVNFEHQ